jgi:hypothetical protein
MSCGQILFLKSNNFVSDSSPYVILRICSEDFQSVCGPSSKYPGGRGGLCALQTDFRSEDQYPQEKRHVKRRLGRRVLSRGPARGWFLNP